MTLPVDYIAYFASNGLKEGALPIEPGWFQLWQIAEVKQWNREYHISEFVPGFLGFGSSGGGELLAFDPVGHVIMIPMVSMSPDEAKLVANSWSEFVEKIEGINPPASSL